jgi:hypothetical protein
MKKDMQKQIKRVREAKEIGVMTGGDNYLPIGLLMRLWKEYTNDVDEENRNEGEFGGISQPTFAGFMDWLEEVKPL